MIFFKKNLQQIYNSHMISHTLHDRVEITWYWAQNLLIINKHV